jgi:hypothetical protein
MNLATEYSDDEVEDSSSVCQSFMTLIHSFYG